MDRDDGQIALESDIMDLLSRISAFDYHDFKNTTFPAPKLALIQKLEWLIKNVKEGKYDNQ